MGQDNSEADPIPSTPSPHPQQLTHITTAITPLPLSPRHPCSPPPTNSSEPNLPLPPPLVQRHLPYALSPLILRANWMSLGMMVTRLAWMAQRLVSSNRDTR